MEALRVVQVCRTAPPRVGGMEAVLEGLSRALAGRGHQVRIVTLGDGGPRPGPVPTLTCRRLGPRRYPTARGLVRAVQGADLVHVHGLDGLADQLVARRREVGAPIGVSTHGGYLHTPRHRHVKRAWLRTGTRWTLRHADAVWFTSRSDRDRLGPACAAGTLVPNGVDLEPFLAVERRPTPGLWVVPGRVDVHKGLDELVRVLAALSATGSAPERVEILGPEEVPGLVADLLSAAERGGVGHLLRFRGAVDRAELARALARCELAVIPSRAEGFGLVAVEAMAAGAPCVVRDLPVFRELLRDGVEGFCIDPAKPERAAAAIRALEPKARERAGRAARLRAAEHGWDRRVHTWERAYARLRSS